VDLGVALPGTHPVLFGVLGGDHQDAANGTGSRAQLTADAALKTVLVAPQVVPSPVALRARRLLLRILGGHNGSEHLAERGPETGCERRHVLAHVLTVLPAISHLC